MFLLFDRLINIIINHMVVFLAIIICLSISIFFSSFLLFHYTSNNTVSDRIIGYSREESFRSIITPFRPLPEIKNEQYSFYNYIPGNSFKIRYRVSWYYNREKTALKTKKIIERYQNKSLFSVLIEHGGKIQEIISPTIYEILQQSSINKDFGIINSIAVVDEIKLGLGRYKVTVKPNIPFIKEMLPYEYFMFFTRTVPGDSAILKKFYSLNHFNLLYINIIDLIIVINIILIVLVVILTKKLTEDIIKNKR